MKHKQNGSRNNKGFFLLLSIIVVFSVLGAVVFSTVRKISQEMSSSAIHNLSESLDLLKGTIEAILIKESECQGLLAQEIASMERPEEFISSYNDNRTDTDYCTRSWRVEV